MTSFVPLQHKPVPSSLRSRSHQSKMLPSTPISEPTVLTNEQLSKKLGVRFSLAHIPINPPLQTPHDAAENRQENNTGLPMPLKASIERVSGLSLDDVSVHYNSPKPAQVQALAYAQGAEIHLGPGQERHLAHEAWHVVQQKQGRAKVLRQVENVALNDDQALECEADIMGRRVPSFAGIHPLHPLEGGGQRTRRYKLISPSGPLSLPIQRKVTSFKPTVKKQDNPFKSLLTRLLPQKDIFEEQDSEVNQRLGKLHRINTVEKSPVPTRIEALLARSNEKNLPRSGGMSAEIAEIGEDEFFLKTGIEEEKFEGGHLIGQQFWTAQDPQQAQASAYENLVPMSRSMNVGRISGWGEKEKILEKMYASDKPVTTTVDVQHYPPYELTLQSLAKKLSLHVKNKEKAKEKVKLESWLPKKVTVHTVQEGEKDEGPQSVEENSLRRFEDPSITTYKELRQALKNSTLRSRIGDSLWAKLKGLADTEPEGEGENKKRKLEEGESTTKEGKMTTD